MQLTMGYLSIARTLQRKGLMGNVNAQFLLINFGTLESDLFRSWKYKNLLAGPPTVMPENFLTKWSPCHV